MAIRIPSEDELGKMAKRKVAIKLCFVDDGKYMSLCHNPHFHMNFPSLKYIVGHITEAETKCGVWCYPNEYEAGCQISILDEKSKPELRPYAILEVTPVGQKLEYRCRRELDAFFACFHCFNFRAVYVNKVLKIVN